MVHERWSLGLRVCSPDICWINQKPCSVDSRPQKLNYHQAMGRCVLIPGDRLMLHASWIIGGLCTGFRLLADFYHDLPFKCCCERHSLKWAESENAFISDIFWFFTVVLTVSQRGLWLIMTLMSDEKCSVFLNTTVKPSASTSWGF